MDTWRWNACFCCWTASSLHLVPYWWPHYIFPKSVPDASASAVGCSLDKSDGFENYDSYLHAYIQLLGFSFADYWSYCARIIASFFDQLPFPGLLGCFIWLSASYIWGSWYCVPLVVFLCISKQVVDLAGLADLSLLIIGWSSASVLVWSRFWRCLDLRISVFLLNGSLCLQLKLLETRLGL